jgi:threonyl-tRNA synthetase
MNFKKQMFDRIYNDIEQDLINYQARLNQLHEQNYNPEKKLTTSEKIILLNEIIPGITLFNDQEQDELVKYLTGTINR